MKGETIMLKKTISYTDYNGVKREEPFYFNLTKDEIAIKTYESIIEDTKDKRKEQQEELNCYDGTLSLCYKMHFESKVTK